MLIWNLNLFIVYCIVIKFITNQSREKFSFSNRIEFSTIAELMEWRKGRSIIFLDSETDTLDYRDGNRWLTQIGDNITQFVIDKTVDIPKELYDDVTVVIHNVIFDYNQLKRDGVVLKKVFCTMVAEQLLTQGLYDKDFIQENKPYSLATLVYDLTSYRMDKGQRLTYKDLNFNEDQIVYAAEDVQYLELVYNDSMRRLIEKDLLDCMQMIENPYTLALGDMLYHGVYLDVDKWLALEKAKKIEVIESNYTIDDSLIEDLPAIERLMEHPKRFQVDLFTLQKVRKLTLNYGSHVQIKKIFSMLKISVKDKHGKETTGINELKKLRVKSKFLDQYIALKELKKKISSYGSNWLRFINPSSGRIHCSVNQILETGRTATYEPNLYQMPRENEYRNCIMVQKPENFFIGGDYSAQEGKIMADKAKDKEYIEFFHTGDGDAHSFVATKMFSAQFYRHIHVTKKQIKIEVLPNEIYKEVADKFIKLSKLKKANHQVVDNYVVLDLSENNEWRQNGKTLNFFLSFGGSAYTLSNDLKIPMDEAVGLVTAFFDGFPTLKAMFELEKKFALENGYTIINPITKRKRFYREWDEMKLTYKWLEEQKNSLGQGYWVQIKDKSSLISKENSKAYKLKGEIERAAMNTPIQGTAADMTKLAFIKLREKIIAEGLLPLDGCPIMPVLVPHDEIRAEVTPEYLELAKTFISDAMAEAGALFVTTIDLTPEIDVEKYWKK